MKNGRISMGKWKDFDEDTNKRNTARRALPSAVDGKRRDDDDYIYSAAPFQRCRRCGAASRLVRSVASLLKTAREETMGLVSGSL